MLSTRNQPRKSAAVRFGRGGERVVASNHSVARPSGYEELSASAATAKVIPVLSTAYFNGFEATPSR